MDDRKKIALARISQHERQHKNQKYVFIDNKSKITNVIFTGASQQYYMMITWFTGANKDSLKYNYLYLNAIYDDVTEEIINSISYPTTEIYNMIGISYGGAAAIFYSGKFRTNAVVSIDAVPIFNFENWSLETILRDNKRLSGGKSVFFIHHSTHQHDIIRHNKFFDVFRNTDTQYFCKCSCIPVHSGNIPNESIILRYIHFGESLNSHSMDFVMKDIKDSGALFLEWT